MAWILLSLLYAVTNAVYVTFNGKHHFNGYVLGIWRGFGISLLVSPLLFTVPLDMPVDYFLILVMQGIMIGIYDSHLFFATSRYGAHASSGFMATTVWVTALLWWSIDFEELRRLLDEPVKLITLGFILCGFSVSYWQMMKVHVSLKAERYLYPAVFALALMSIATRYIALNGGSAYAGVVYYLTVACFVSGIYNLVGFCASGTCNDGAAAGSERVPLRTDCDKRDELVSPSPLPPPPRGRRWLRCKMELLSAPLKHWNGAWLVLFSTVLIGAKTLALRLADNPAYVVAMLLLSPMFAEVIQTHRLKLTPYSVLVVLFLTALLLLVG